MDILNKMKQIIQSKGNIVEKVLRDREGRLVRAKFFVYENAGRVKARLVDLKYLEEAILLTASKIFLPFYKKLKSIYVQLFPKQKFAYQFVQCETLYVSGSKPRAPTF